MMKTVRASFCLLALAWAALCLAAAQTVTLRGLRLTNHRGSFRAAHYAADGSLILLYDQGDGVRLLHTDPQAARLLTETQVGSAGDTGISMALDPAGNIYIAGTSTSATLSGTQGAAFPARADASTNSFVAKFDPGLHLVFLTFCGAGRTAVTGIAATADAVFLTGATYTNAFPTSPGAVLPTATKASTGNGFVERFSSDGSTLIYATYITGANGVTTPYAVTADASDNAYVVGETSSPAYPSAAALRPTFSGTVSGFLTKLSPAGDTFPFSTLIPGSGLTGIGIDPSAGTLLVSGNVDPGRFPVTTVWTPLMNEPYQGLLRITEDGQTLLQSVLVAPGTSSFVTAGPGGDAWLSGSLGTPTPDMAGFGDSFLLHVAADTTVGVLQRFGGLPTTDAGYATMSSTVGAPAVAADGNTAILPATLSASVSADLASNQHFDISLNAAGSEILPDNLGDLLPAACPGFGQCDGSAGLLAGVSLNPPASTLGTSTGDLPNLTVRNEGPLAASGVSLNATGYSVETDCGSTLLPGAQCGVALSGAGPGTLQVTAANAGPIRNSVSASSGPVDPLALDVAELDFGVVTAASSPVSRTITVTNLSAANQTFGSAQDGAPGSSPYTLAEASSTCAGTAPAHTLAPGAACTVTLILSASSQTANDGPVRAAWKIGQRDVAVTSNTQAATLSLSSPVLDFGVTYSGGHDPLPLSLYLSNLSTHPVPHTPVVVSGSLPFGVTDHCPSTLEPGSVCQITATYTPAAVPAADGFVLELDDDLNVLLEGTRLIQPPSTAASAVTVSPVAYTFTDPVVVTAVSKTNGVVTLTNSTAAAVPVITAVTGDFQLADSCDGAVPAGGSCTLSLVFAPSQPGPRTGILSLSLGSGSAPVIVPLTGVGSELLASENGILQLGATLVGEPAFAWYKVAAPVENLTATVAGSGFRVALVEEDGFGHGALPLSAFAPVVSGGCSNCWLGVAFVPSSAGSATGNLSLTSGLGGAAYQLSLSGVGLPVTGLVFTPAAPDFGTVPLGSTSAPLQIEVTNLLLPIASFGIQNITANGDFEVVPTSATGLPCVGELLPSASCFINVAFSPAILGTRKGILTITTTGGTTYLLPLTGSGAPDPGLGFSPLALTFNKPGAGGATLQQQILTITNNNPRSLAINTVASSNASFVPSTRCGTLAPGSSCTVVVQFTPGTSEATGLLSISVLTEEANGQLHPVQETIPLTATYTADEVGLVLLPAETDFGDASTGALGATHQFTLLNTSSAAETINLTLPRNFPLATPSDCVSLDPGASCSFSVSFLPETGGAVTGSILATALSNGKQSQAIGYLQGYGEGVGTLTVTDEAVPGGTLNFGVLTSDTSSQQVLTLTNTGAGPVTVRRIGAAPPFFVQTDCGTTLPPGGSCTATVVYAPTFQLSGVPTNLAPRTDRDTLLIESDAASSPDEVDLNGTVLPVVSSGPPSPVALTSYTLSQGALSFANAQVGDVSEPQTLTLLNTGNTTLDVAGIGASPDFVESDTCSSVLPASTCTVTVRFAPNPAPSNGLRPGTLTVRSNAADALEFVTLMGLSTPSPITLLPGSLSFGSVQLGSASHSAATVTNSASLPIAFTGLAATGDYTVSPGTCPAAGASLAAGQSCTLDIIFTPGATGTRTGILNLTTNAAQSPLVLKLTGIGTAPRLSVDQSSLLFGDLKVGSSSTLTLNLANSGSAILERLTASINGDAAPDFHIVAPCPTDTYTPLTGCTLQVTFTPSAVGTRTATLVLNSSDPASPLSVSLSGTGTPASSFILTVNGASAATATVAPGGPAKFPLLLTPKDGFTGAVAFACLPIAPGPYAACALEKLTMSISGSPQSSAATLTTLGPTRVTGFRVWALLFSIPLALARRKRQAFLRLVLLLSASALLPLSGCGGPGSSGQYVTPPGTYQFQVTARSPDQPTLTSTVTLTLVVQ